MTAADHPHPAPAIDAYDEPQVVFQSLTPRQKRKARAAIRRMVAAARRSRPDEPWSHRKAWLIDSALAALGWAIIYGLAYAVMAVTP